MKVRQSIFDTYWYFAYNRQEIFFKRLQGESPPYTSDAILNTYKFCNVYRASDRVSQFLIKEVIYSYKTMDSDTLFRTFLFRLLNKVETWIELEKIVGEITLKNFSVSQYSFALEKIKELQPIYGNAFILCANKAFGFDQKHKNHLALLEKVFLTSDFSQKLTEAKTLKELFTLLHSLPLIGDFMAYQLAIDFNYSEVFSFNENDFTIAGPGARRGIEKCFLDTDGKGSEYVIFSMVENQEKEFNRLSLDFKNLWGRDLHAIDCQGLFCEVDKYSRVKFPELKSNRVQIKAKFKPSPKSIKYFYPPKWGINPVIK
jgi:hypothetical protein